MNRLPKIAIFLVGFFCNGWAQHIPPCQGTYHDESICYGYAVARAFDKAWNDALCPASTLHLTAVGTTYFAYFSTFSYGDISEGDIIEFAGHVAYVADIDNRTDSGIKLDQVEGEGGSEQKSLQLGWVINGHSNPNVINRGAPTGYYRKKKAWPMTIENRFGNGQTGGKVEVNSSQKDSPYTFNVHWLDNISLEAIEDGNSHGGYKQIFRQWERNHEEIATTKSVDVYRDDYNTNQTYTYTAKFVDEYHATFQNSFTGVGNAGIIEINSENCNLPHSAFPVAQDKSISAEALPQLYNGIHYTFLRWQDNNTANPRTFEPTGHTTYTAYYTGRPASVTITSCSGTPGTYVTIQWQEHVNANVSQYQVWRKVKHTSQGGWWEGPDLLATLNRGTTSFTDTEYIFTDGYTDDLLQYDIRPYYSVENSYAEPDFITIFAEQDLTKPSAGPVSTQQPHKVNISAFPNPFNATITLAFQIMEDALVSVKIYTIRGQEVASLTSKNHSRGAYNYFWAAQDEQGLPLPSGLFLARLVLTPLHGKPIQTSTIRLLLVR